MHIDKHKRGFMAMISVMLLSIGILAFSISSLASATMYSDMVYRREIRIQVNANLSSCMNTAKLMIQRDYFIYGTSTLSEFGCTIHISNDFMGNTSIYAIAELSGIKEIGNR